MNEDNKIFPFKRYVMVALLAIFCVAAKCGILCYLIDKTAPIFGVVLGAAVGGYFSIYASNNSFRQQVDEIRKQNRLILKTYLKITANAMDEFKINPSPVSLELMIMDKGLWKSLAAAGLDEETTNDIANWFLSMNILSNDFKAIKRETDYPKLDQTGKCEFLKNYVSISDNDKELLKKINLIRNNL